MDFIIVGLFCIIVFLLQSRSTFIQENDEIPRIIHQTAPADESKWNTMWKPCQESWKTKFPDWEYRMWTDEDLDNLIETKYSWFYPTYKEYPKNINRFDAARYFILYEYGGIYADMDYECIKNFEHLLPTGKACANESPWNHEFYQNALMASPVRHPFWKEVWKELENHKNDDNVLTATGPEIIHEAAKKNPDMFYAFPKKNFAQEHASGFKAYHEDDSKNSEVLMKQVYTSNMYARHHSTAVWN